MIMMWLIVQVRFTSKIKQHYYDRSNGVQSMKKNTQNNDVTDRIDTIYAKIGTKMSWSIE